MNKGRMIDWIRVELSDGLGQNYWMDCGREQLGE